MKIWKSSSCLMLWIMKIRRHLKRNFIIQKKTSIERINRANTAKKLIKIKTVDSFIQMKLSIALKIDIWMKRLEKRILKKRKIMSTKRIVKAISRKCLQYYHQQKASSIKKRIISDIWTRRQSIIYVMISVYSSLISLARKWKQRLSSTIYWKFMKSRLYCSKSILLMKAIAIFISSTFTIALASSSIYYQSKFWKFRSTNDMSKMIY